jgi:hypothetical protein
MGLPRSMILWLMMAVAVAGLAYGVSILARRRFLFRQMAETHARMAKQCRANAQSRREFQDVQESKIRALFAIDPQAVEVKLAQARDETERSVQEQLAWSSNFERVVRKFERLARYPWLPMPPVPPEPK